MSVPTYPVSSFGTMVLPSIPFSIDKHLDIMNELIIVSSILQSLLVCSHLSISSKSRLDDLTLQLMSLVSQLKKRVDDYERDHIQFVSQ